MRDDSEARARATWQRARRELGASIAALEFGEAASTLAVGGASESPRVIRVDLGVEALGRTYLQAPNPGEGAIEQAIVEVEERIMPLRRHVPVDAYCVTMDRRVARVAAALGLATGDGWVPLPVDRVEDAFNRWVSIALGRPSTQDTLPVDATFAATLLVLREWLHHFACADIRWARP